MQSFNYLKASLLSKTTSFFFDNWFTSLDLIAHLATRGIWCCGTVQPQRLHNLTFKTDKQMMMHGRGSYDEWESQVEDTKITAVKWMDKRSVHLASSFLHSSPMDKCVRYEKKLKKKGWIPTTKHCKGIQHSYGWCGSM